MKNISIFQLVILGVFFFFIMAGAVVVAVFSKQGGSTQRPVTVTIWGTLEHKVMMSVITEMQKSQKNITVTYVQKNPTTFDFNLVEAIATGVGPDIVLLRQDAIVPTLLKIYPISYDVYPARDFRDTFLEEGELFLTSYGIIALPFSIDPLVMYWNRDIFSREGLSSPPRFWDEIFSLASKLTKRNVEGGITQAAVALGEFQNIVNAKEIFSILLLQSGNQIATWNSRFSSSDVSLSKAPIAPENILTFYTQFADPRKSVYSWNRALSDSKSMFLSGRLGIYLGFASELREILAKSPNLNFDVTYLPQSRNGKVSGTFGHLYGLAVLRTSKDPVGAATVVQMLTTKPSIERFVSETGLPSVRKDIEVSSSDLYQPIFRNSALVSRAWIDPGKQASDTVFKDMIETVVSGFATPAEAIGKAEQQLRYFTPRQ